MVYNRPHGMMGAPTNPYPATGGFGPDELDVACVTGKGDGWAQGFAGVEYDDSTSADADVAFAKANAEYRRCYALGYNEGMIAAGTGTRPCSVENVQNALNAAGATPQLEPTGTWDIATEAAFVASGKTCAQLVASCTECPGRTSPTPPPEKKDPPVVVKEAPKEASVWPWFIGSAIVVGASVWLLRGKGR